MGLSVGETLPPKRSDRIQLIVMSHDRGVWATIQLRTLSYVPIPSIGYICLWLQETISLQIYLLLTSQLISNKDRLPFSSPSLSQLKVIRLTSLLYLLPTPVPLALPDSPLPVLPLALGPQLLLRLLPWLLLPYPTGSCQPRNVLLQLRFPMTLRLLFLNVLP